MAQHAKLSPSSASRWLRCPGSINLNQSLDDIDTAGIAADEGTILHSFCESVLNSRKTAFEFIGQTRNHNGYFYTLTEEDAEQIQEGIDEIDTLFGELYIEERIDLSRWMPGQFGTLDVGIVDNKIIHIWDWKWGFVPVSPIKNEQLMLYGLGFWEKVRRTYPKIEKVRLHIFQPRAMQGGGNWTVSLDDLLIFGEEVREKAELTISEDAPRIPGSIQCLYCSAAKNLSCKEYSEYNLSAIISDFDEMDDLIEDDLPVRLPNTTGISPKRRSFILQNWTAIEKWKDRLTAQAVSDFLKGDPVPGMKVVLGNKGRRKYTEDGLKAAEILLTKALGEEAFSKKLITPAQAEKVLPGALYGKLKSSITQQLPNNVLVSDLDDRPAVPKVADLFD